MAHRHWVFLANSQATVGQIDLYLPQFKHKLCQLEQSMPFKPKDSYYYRLEPKKTGKGEKMVKLHEGWKCTEFKTAAD